MWRERTLKPLCQGSVRISDPHRRCQREVFIPQSLVLICKR
jgi:hypothetical protein